MVLAPGPAETFGLAALEALACGTPVVVWSVDRLHPNEPGHRLIACRFHALLAASGCPVGPGPDPEPSNPPPTRLAEAGWMATKGTAWLVRRSRDLVPSLVRLAVREWLAGADAPEDGRDDARRDDARRDDARRDDAGQDGAGRPPVNLNVLSRPSGNLRLNRGLPSAPLKVGGRSSKRNERTAATQSGTDLGAEPMSQTYDPNNSEQHPSGQGHLAGPGYAGGAGYPGGPGYGAGYGFATEPPPPPRRNHKRRLVITGAAALVAGAAAGGLIGGLHSTSVSMATATSKTALSASQIAARVDPGLVDVVSTLGDQQATAAGTGIVLTSNGEILTNNHVIDGATSIKVTDIGNGRTYTASVVGYDASQDVAVIQLQNASGLTVASLGDSTTVQTGDSVTALGNAGGKGGTPSVASGTVTALNQSITASDEGSGNSEQLTGLIETNANIQPGDSGGSLVNAYGQVIGMDTAASSGTQFQSQSGQAAEQAYAIPINEATSIATQIEAGTTSANVHIGATAFLGIESQPTSQGSGSGFGGSGSGGSGFGGSGFGGLGGSQGNGTSGVTISGTLSGSPAANAGLTAGDTITSVGGQSVSTAKDIANVLVKYHPGDSISITWADQSGQSQSTNVTLANGPAA